MGAAFTEASARKPGNATFDKAGFEGRAIIDSGREAGDYASKIIRNEMPAIP